jgi:hypothetical protein
MTDNRGLKMTFAQAASLLGIVSFLISIVAILITIVNRAQGQGRLAQAIDAATTSDREVSKMVQAQGLALERFAQAMTEQGSGLREIAQSFREYSAQQRETNQDLWTAIQVQSGRVNRLFEEHRALHCKFPGGETT